MAIPQHARLVVKLYLNLGSLSRVYEMKRIVRASHMLDCYKGFLQSQPLFDIIDCGKGKEGADEKIRGEYKAFWSVINLP